MYPTYRLGNTVVATYIVHSWALIRHFHIIYGQVYIGWHNKNGKGVWMLIIYSSFTTPWLLWHFHKLPQPPNGSTPPRHCVLSPPQILHLTSLSNVHQCQSFCCWTLGNQLNLILSKAGNWEVTNVTLFILYFPTELSESRSTWGFSDSTCRTGARAFSYQANPGNRLDIPWYTEPLLLSFLFTTSVYH